MIRWVTDCSDWSTVPLTTLPAQVEQAPVRSLAEPLTNPNKPSSMMIRWVTDSSSLALPTPPATAKSPATRRTNSSKLYASSFSFFPTHSPHIILSECYNVLQHG